jgi:hypothetical protein
MGPAGSLDSQKLKSRLLLGTQGLELEHMALTECVSVLQIHPWTIWGFWISPLMYAQQAISVNEFRAGVDSPHCLTPALQRAKTRP